MVKKCLLMLVIILPGLSAYTQKTPVDTSVSSFNQILASDTTLDYDELFNDFEAFMDSILTPRSYFMPTLSVSRGYFNFYGKTTNELISTSKLTYTPMLTWYHKSGLGISVTGYMIDDNKNFNLYQGSLTPSFDYLQNHDLAFGASYTRFFSKDSLPFYTSPLKNELYGYFMYRKWWMKPALAVSYGWGSRSDYESREEQILSLRLRQRGYTYINTTETVSDFSVTASVRHDFYWLNVLGHRDHARLTPQLSFASGTQKFGFNQSSSTYITTVRNSINVLYSSESVYLDDKVNFQPLSLTFYLRGEYSVGKLFIQPQFMLDYYFPAKEDKFSSLFSVSVGLVL